MQIATIAGKPIWFIGPVHRTSQMQFIQGNFAGILKALPEFFKFRWRFFKISRSFFKYR